MIRKEEKIFSRVPALLSPLKINSPIQIDSDSPVGLLGATYYDLEGGGDNEANSDDSDYEEPSFDDGDFDEVSRVFNFKDYDFVPEASPQPYMPTPQPELEGVIYQRTSP